MDGSGYGTVASHLGLPDAGLAGYGDMVERVRTFSSLSTAPLICDGDTGYGGLLNVAHTVNGYERAGAAAIQLEDQVANLVTVICNVTVTTPSHPPSSLPHRHRYHTVTVTRLLSTEH